MASGRTSNPQAKEARTAGGLAALGMSALGIVFGDIGTSPLYTFKTVLQMTGGNTQAATLGCLSLIVWTLIIVTTIKYVMVAMRVNNHGEGGILALMALLSARGNRRPAIVVAGLLGAALIYGDGAITPSISVLSALEGLSVASPRLAQFALPGSVAILVALFVLQAQGTARIGRLFGPVMALWFLTIGALGISGIVRHPGVLVALSPAYAVGFLIHGGLGAFFVLGGIFLCVTGAEALYADMGHFGARPIRAAWLAVVFPCLVLSYAGQAALVLDGVKISDNIFFRLCPPVLLLPLVALATVATIIASQSIITGAFSMTRQAIQLGWLPRLHVTHTSAEGYGQIYVGTVNWLLMIVTVALTLGFKKSDNLASAYGIAVSATMLMTSALLYIAMREELGWSRLAAGLTSAGFMIVDASFFAANLAKVADGGYVPLVLAGTIYLLMWIWHRGSCVVTDLIQDCIVPIGPFLADFERRKLPRVPGTAVFLTRTERDTPPVMVWHVKHNRALHEHLLVLSVQVVPMPWADAHERLKVHKIAPNLWRATARYGFMERPNVPELVNEAATRRGCHLDLEDVTYYVGRETIIREPHHHVVSRWVEALFAVMQRNSAHVTEFFQLPSESVVEIGREIAI